MQFLDVLIRQAHPGERRGPYRSYGQKLADARDYLRDEVIPWPVLVDDLAGTVHQAYGGLADPVYLIDAAGRVAFYGMWTHVPTLKQAIDALLAQGGQGGPVAEGINHTPHMFASFVNGWHAVQRGGRRAALDLELAVPGAATLTYLGHLAKPLLTPVALRATPLPMAGQLALWGGTAIAAAGAAGWLRLRPRA